MIESVIGDRLKPLARENWPAAAAWIAATITVLATSKVAGYAPFSPETWSRWDSNLYLDIARHGYTLFRCSPPEAGDWCGNAGWFPAYPWLLRALGTVGLPLTATAVTVAWVFSAATILLLGRTFLRGASLPVVAALAYAAFAPGQVFFYAISPLSMLACFLVIHLWLLHRGRWVVAGVTGAIAAMCHPVGVLAIVSSALWIAITRGEPHRERWRRIAIVSGIGVLGPVVIVADQAIEVHRVNAYLLVQAKYGHGIQDPLGPVVNALHLVARTSPFALVTAPAVQSILVAFLIGCVLIELLVHRRTALASDWLLALWGTVTWLLPHMAGNVTLSRSEAALALLAVLARRLPRPLLALLLALAVWLTIAMTQLFLRGALV
jgi:hypothetical protein